MARAAILPMIMPISAPSDNAGLWADVEPEPDDVGIVAPDVVVLVTKVDGVKVIATVVDDDERDSVLAGTVMVTLEVDRSASNRPIPATPAACASAAQSAFCPQMTSAPFFGFNWGFIPG